MSDLYSTLIDYNRDNVAMVKLCPCFHIQIEAKLIVADHISAHSVHIHASNTTRMISIE